MKQRVQSSAGSEGISCSTVLQASMEQLPPRSHEELLQDLTQQVFLPIKHAYPSCSPSHAVNLICSGLLLAEWPFDLLGGSVSIEIQSKELRRLRTPACFRWHMEFV